MGAKQMTTERQLQQGRRAAGGSRRAPAYAGAPACGMLSRPTTADTNNSPSSSFTDSLKCGGIPASSEQEHPRRLRAVPITVPLPWAERLLIWRN